MEIACVSLILVCTGLFVSACIGLVLPALMRRIHIGKAPDYPSDQMRETVEREPVATPSNEQSFSRRYYDPISKKMVRK